MKIFSMTDTGKRRDMNQDYLYASDTAVGKLPNLFIAADGMGGHKAGDYASRVAVEVMVECVKNDEDGLPVLAIKRAITEANRIVLRASLIDIDKEGMGTTIVAACIVDDKIIAANVGDSRLYIVNEHSIQQITIDHSYVEEMVRCGKITREAARNHKNKNAITRAVGVFQEVEADFFEAKVMPGDTVLLCTDGLTNMVEDEEIKRIILSQRDIVEKTETLVETANRNGGTDNITVVLIEPFA